MELLKAMPMCRWDGKIIPIVSPNSVAADEESRKMEFLRRVEDEFEIIDRGGGFYECLPLGHSKATAVEAVLRRFGIAKEDAWVFGDSMNDYRCSIFSQLGFDGEKHDSGLEPYAVFKIKDSGGRWYRLCLRES